MVGAEGPPVPVEPPLLELELLLVCPPELELLPLELLLELLLLWPPELLLLELELDPAPELELELELSCVTPVALLAAVGSPPPQALNEASSTAPVATIRVR